jgi:hypothetical protein
VPQRFAEWDAIDYRAKIDALCRTHIDNHFVTADGRMWDFTAPVVNASWYEESTVLCVHGSGKWLEKSWHYSPILGMYDIPSFGQYLDSDSAYNIWSGETPDSPYKINRFSLEWSKPEENAGTFGIFASTKQVYFPRPGEKLLSSEVSRYEGRGALRLTTHYPDRAITNIIYLDRDTYQLLYAESDKSLHYDGRLATYADEKSITRLTYRDAGDKRYPAKYERYRLTADGRRMPMREYEFTEYTPYTPTADDLDLEKQFGVKPVEHEPRPARGAAVVGAPAAKPASPGFSLKFDGWYVAGGVLFLAVVGLVVFSRRWGRP